MKRAIRAGDCRRGVGIHRNTQATPLADKRRRQPGTRRRGSPTFPCKVSDPCVDVNPGAASPEPPQEVESEVHDKAQGESITSIWTTP